MKNTLYSIVASVARFCGVPSVLMANAFPPSKDNAAAPAAPGGGEPKPINKAGESEPGKGNQPDPGTGKTVDFRAMVMQLLGLQDDAEDQALQEAFNSCMATEPDEEDKAIKGKLDEATVAKDEAVADKVEAEKANEALKLQLAEKETLAANETAAKDALLKRVEVAEAAFANERNAHCKTIVNDAVLLGKLTKAEAEAKEKELANAKTPAEFDAAVLTVANAAVKLNTSTGTTGLERTIAPGTASHEFQSMVNEAVKSDVTNRPDKWSFHWTECSKSEKGKSLLAQMRQPKSNVPK